MTTARLIGVLLVVAQAGLTTAALGVGDLGAPPWVKLVIGIAATMVTTAAVLIDPSDESKAPAPHG